MSLADATEVHVVGAKFESNKGAFGGAVSMISTANTTGRFESCRFDSNDATNGGALYTVTGDTGASEHTMFVQEAVFLNNVAGEI